MPRHLRQDVYSYNSKLQLTGVTKPGLVGDNFVYNNAGELDGSRWTDASTGAVTLAVARRDAKGRALVTTQTSANAGLVGGAGTSTLVSAYTNLDQLKREQSGLSGAGTVYEYFGPTENTGGAAAGALKSRKLMKGSTVLKEEVYAYDSSTKRLEKITLKVPDQDDQVVSAI